MIGWTALVALLGLGAWLGWGAWRRWQEQRAEERHARWRQAAQAMDFAFSTTDATRELAETALPFLERADTTAVAPVLTGPAPVGRVRVFHVDVGRDRCAVGVLDLTREVGPLGLRPRDGSTPEVLVGVEPRPTGIAHVDTRFEVRTDDPDFARSVLESEAGGWLGGEAPPWSFELAGRHLLAAGPAVPPEELGDLVEVLESFWRRLPWAPEEPDPVVLPSDKEAAEGDGGSGRRRRRKR